MLSLPGPQGVAQDVRIRIASILSPVIRPPLSRTWRAALGSQLPTIAGSSASSLNGASRVRRVIPLPSELPLRGREPAARGVLRDEVTAAHKRQSHGALRAAQPRLPRRASQAPKASCLRPGRHGVARPLRYAFSLHR